MRSWLASIALHLPASSRSIDLSKWVLAFVRSGFDGEMQGRRPAEKRALRWLIAQQRDDGCVGERGNKYMYNHALATLALAEASDRPIVRDAAQRAVDFLVAAQNPGKGWRYSARSGDNDSFVTGWCVLALHAAARAGTGRSGRSGSRRSSTRSGRARGRTAAPPAPGMRWTAGAGKGAASTRPPSTP